MSGSNQTISLFWDQLLSLMNQGKVIPVVGHDAIVVEDAPGKPTLNEYLARRVEVKLGLKPSKPAVPVNLHEVASRFLKAEGKDEIGSVYTAVNQALAEREIPIPETLRKLAAIRAFNLYITTTFDDLLRRALDQERFGDEPADGEEPRQTLALAYTPSRAEDLPDGAATLPMPVVYHLLGRVSALQDYVVTEEDTLEFVHSLQSGLGRPVTLMDQFRDRSILMIGSGYSDWLMRFFIRITKSDRLLLASSKTVVVDERNDVPLARFLSRFSPQTRVFRNAAATFVDELYERWETFSRTAPRPTPAASSRRLPERRFFLSYASKDSERAVRLASAMRAAGLPVWVDRPVGYDEPGLKGGMVWDDEIRKQIQQACFFTPVLTQRSTTVENHYFRTEWTEALQVGTGAPANRPFIIPIYFEDVPKTAPELPPRFREVQWLGARTDEELRQTVQRLREMYRDYQRRRAAEPV